MSLHPLYSQPSSSDPRAIPSLLVLTSKCYCSAKEGVLSLVSAWSHAHVVSWGKASVRTSRRGLIFGRPRRTPTLLHVGACAAPSPAPAPCPAPSRLDLRPHGMALAPPPHPRAWRQAQQLQQATPIDGSHYNMCNARSTYATFI
jgi:hypothetical protein